MRSSGRHRRSGPCWHPGGLADLVGGHGRRRRRGSTSVGHSHPDGHRDERPHEVAYRHDGLVKPIAANPIAVRPNPIPTTQSRLTKITNETESEAMSPAALTSRVPTSDRQLTSSSTTTLDPAAVRGSEDPRTTEPTLAGASRIASRTAIRSRANRLRRGHRVLTSGDHPLLADEAENHQPLGSRAAASPTAVRWRLPPSPNFDLLFGPRHHLHAQTDGDFISGAESLALWTDRVIESSDVKAADRHRHQPIPAAGARRLGW